MGTKELHIAEELLETRAKLKEQIKDLEEALADIEKPLRELVNDGDELKIGQWTLAKKPRSTVVGNVAEMFAWLSRNVGAVRALDFLDKDCSVSGKSIERIYDGVKDKEDFFKLLNKKTTYAFEVKKC